MDRNTRDTGITEAAEERAGRTGLTDQLERSGSTSEGDGEATRHETAGTNATELGPKRRKRPLRAVVACLIVIAVLAGGGLVAWNLLGGVSPADGPDLPDECYYAVQRVEVYDSDDELSYTMDNTLSGRGVCTKTSVVNYYDGKPTSKDVTFYDTDEQYGISVPVDYKGRSADIKVEEADEFGQPLKYTYLDTSSDVTVSVECSYYDNGCLQEQVVTRQTRGDDGPQVFTTRYREDGWANRYMEGQGSDEVVRRFKYKQRDGQVRSRTTENNDSDSSYVRQWDEGTEEFRYVDGMVAERTDEDGTTYRYTYVRINDPAPLVAANNRSHEALF